MRCLISSPLHGVAPDVPRSGPPSDQDPRPASPWQNWQATAPFGIVAHVPESSESPPQSSNAFAAVQLRNEWYAWAVLGAAIVLVLFVSNRQDLWGEGCYDADAKVLWAQQADIVIGGSSRAQAGIALEQFQHQFFEKRVRNFGFDMAIFTPG